MSLDATRTHIERFLLGTGQPERARDELLRRLAHDPRHRHRVARRLAVDHEPDRWRSLAHDYRSVNHHADLAGVNEVRDRQTGRLDVRAELIERPHLPTAPTISAAIASSASSAASWAAMRLDALP